MEKRRLKATVFEWELFLIQLEVDKQDFYAMFINRSDDFVKIYQIVIHSIFMYFYCMLERHLCQLELFEMPKGQV